jgi:type II secretory pathway pseudopilin PulG
MNRKRRHHGGFTIVELLVASTVGLLLVLGVIEAFRQITHAVNKGRANVQLSGKLRNTINLMREDFQGITVPAIPNISTDSGAGYFEIIEGEDNDLISSAGSFDTLTGDTDDVIMFTSRRLGEPFSGRFKGKTITSPNAEIIYWLDLGIWNGSAPLKHNDMPLATLRRRALLIRPDLNENGEIPGSRSTGFTSDTVKNFLNENDISVRVNSNGSLSANTLSDLTLRQNRVAHKCSPAGFPNPYDPTYLPHQWDHKDPTGNSTLDVYSLGEDVVMDQVIGFDIRVYDPAVYVVEYSSSSNPPEPPEPLVPGDEGYMTRATTVIGNGAYIDLGFASRINRTQLQVGGTALCVDTSYRPYLGDYNVYDTWTIEYERDGINQNFNWSNNNRDDNGDGVKDGPGEAHYSKVDPGSNGIDDNPDVNAGVDDATEREAPPPYSVPLRGFQVIVRVFQTGQQQTRQFTITHDFTPE